MKLNESEAASTIIQVSLREKVKQFMQQYFSQLKNEKPTNIYNFIIDEIEEPLLIKVMRETGYNQSEAARVLGFARGTLRAKLKKFGMLEEKKVE